MKLNEFNIEKVMLDYQSHKFDEMKEIVNETIKENKTLNNTINIQKLKIDTLEKEKQRLISFLEIKIKESKKKAKEYEQEREFDWQIYEEHTVEICQEVLDFVEKGGKE